MNLFLNNIESKHKNKVLLIFFTLATIFLSWLIFKQGRRDEYINNMLNNTLTTDAVVIKVVNGGVKRSKHCEYKYLIKGEKYIFQTQGDFSFLKVGDTIQIKYSVKDHSIATVENPLIMKRFK